MLLLQCKLLTHNNPLFGNVDIRCSPSPNNHLLRDPRIIQLLNVVQALAPF